MTDYTTYESIPAIRWSTLKAMAQSPAHYHYRLTHPREDTPAMARGRAVHCAVLEPDSFPLRYVVWDGGRRYGKTWDAFCEANTGREIISADEYARCLAIRDAVRDNPMAAYYLADGLTEQTIEWTDPATGLACKARLDLIGGGALADLKTTNDIEADHFGRTCARYGYHGQLAFYRNGLAQAAGTAPAPVRIIAVESDPPHDVAVFVLDDDCLYAGEEEVAEYLAKVKECTESGEWPGRYSGEQVLELPAWAYPDQEDEMVLMGLKPAGGDK